MDVRKKGKESTDMKRIRIGSNFTVFLLFFGIALLEAVQSANWLKVLFWLGIGAFFILADSMTRKNRL